jgi:hypothetical protein
MRLSYGIINAVFCLLGISDLACAILPTMDGFGKAGVAESVDATDLSQIECPRGNGWCRTAQIRGTLLNGDPEPSFDAKAPLKV